MVESKRKLTAAVSPGVGGSGHQQVFLVGHLVAYGEIDVGKLVRIISQIEGAAGMSVPFHHHIIIGIPGASAAPFPVTVGGRCIAMYVA